MIKAKHVTNEKGGVNKRALGRWIQGELTSKASHNVNESKHLKKPAFANVKHHKEKYLISIKCQRGCVSTLSVQK